MVRAQINETQNFQIGDGTNTLAVSRIQTATEAPKQVCKAQHAQPETATVLSKVQTTACAQMY